MTNLGIHTTKPDEMYNVNRIIYDSNFRPAKDVSPRSTIEENHSNMGVGQTKPEGHKVYNIPLHSRINIKSQRFRVFFVNLHGEFPAIKLFGSSVQT